MVKYRAPPIPVEAPTRRQMLSLRAHAQVPLPDDGRGVAELGQPLREGLVLPGQAAHRVGPEHARVDPRGFGVLPRQYGSPAAENAKWH